jgi:hypothetical protein
MVHLGDDFHLQSVVICCRFVFSWVHGVPPLVQDKLSFALIRLSRHA